jgi:Ca2+-binding RTX toxin-like protein
LFGDDGRVLSLDAADNAIGVFGGGAGIDVLSAAQASSVSALSVQCDTSVAVGVAADQLYGGIGRDVLVGGRGADRLSLGTESLLNDTRAAGDVMIGDSGAVRLVLVTASGGGARLVPLRVATAATS